jgi:hypothetical protein
MRRHFTYGSSLDPLSRSGTVTGSVTPGGAFASSLTSSGRTLSSGGTSRGTFTVPTLTADVYTPSGGLGTGTSSSTPSYLTFTGSAGIDGFTPSQEIAPDYMRLDADALAQAFAAGTPSRRAFPLRAVLPPGTVTSSGRGGFSFSPSRATLPGGRRTLPWTSITSAPVDMSTLDTGLFSETPSMDTAPDTYTVPMLDTRGGIGGYTKDGGYYVVPTMPGGPAVRKGAQEKKAVAAPMPTPDAGFPWGWLLLAAGAGAAYLHTRKRGSAK